MMNLEVMLNVVEVSKAYPVSKHASVSAVKAVSFNVSKGAFFTLLGPSGCGKSTLLRCIAGIETPNSGQISIGGVSVFSVKDNIDISANKRNLGMVFQSFAIWPHMSVFENVAFGLRAVQKAKGWSKSEITERAMSALETVSLNTIGSRRGADLSGGQKQRLALARSIAAEPKLILLDEPLSNLDAKLRGVLREELKSLQAKLGLTFVYVTHDQHEALSMSDQIAVMKLGKIQQIGTPQDIYLRPHNRFVAEFIGKSNAVFGNENQLIRPEDIHLSPNLPEGGSWQECRIVQQNYFGEYSEVTVSLKGQEFIVRTTGKYNSLTNGLLYISFDSEKVIQV